MLKRGRLIVGLVVLSLGAAPALAYAGEALVETLPMGDKRLISYGVDLGTRVTTAFDSSQSVVREIHLRRGVLTSRLAAQEMAATPRFSESTTPERWLGSTMAPTVLSAAISATTASSPR